MVFYVADTQVGTCRAHRSTQEQQTCVQRSNCHVELLLTADWLPRYSPQETKKLSLLIFVGAISETGLCVYECVLGSQAAVPNVRPDIPCCWVPCCCSLDQQTMRKMRLGRDSGGQCSSRHLHSILSFRISVMRLLNWRKGSLRVSSDNKFHWEMVLGRKLPPSSLP